MFIIFSFFLMETNINNYNNYEKKKKKEIILILKDTGDFYSLRFNTKVKKCYLKIKFVVYTGIKHPPTPDQVQKSKW